MEKLTIAFPFRAGCEFREKSFPFVMQAYQDIVPYADFITVDSGDTPFNRAATRNRCVQRAESGVVVIADADILPDAAALLESITAARDEGGLHLGYDYYRALMKESTQRFYYDRTNPSRHDKRDPSLLPMAFDSTTSTCGIVVMRCDQWFLAGGMDERFTGWGFEDTAFAIAVETMIGPLTNHHGTVNHLWHPSACNLASEQYKLNEALCARYAAAKGNVKKMQELINESGRISS